MSKQLKLAFGIISTKLSTKTGINLIDYFFEVLDNTEPIEKDKRVESFLDIDIKTLEGKKYLIGFYGYASGDSYRTISNNKTIIEEQYPDPPLKDKAMFLITESGHIIFEEKDSPISPAKIKDALVQATKDYLGNYSVVYPIYIDFLELSESSDTMIEFIYSLNSLKEIEFSDLKHSNPESRSQMLDAAVNGGIDDIYESSEGSSGIDRENDFIKNQIAHIKNNYGIIKQVSGMANEGFQRMKLKNNNIQFTVNIKNDDSETIISNMLSVWDQLKDKFKIKGK